eukprot:11748591-Ditylum_brightwellii.AAC.1
MNVNFFHSTPVTDPVISKCLGPSSINNQYQTLCTLGSDEAVTQEDQEEEAVPRGISGTVSMAKMQQRHEANVTRLALLLFDADDDTGALSYLSSLFV